MFQTKDHVEKECFKHIIWCKQLSWKRKLATVKSLKADVSCDEKTNVRNVNLKLFTMANLRFQLTN